MEIVMTAFDVSEFEAGEVEIEIENLSNLRHPLISKAMVFASGEGEGKLKIGRLHAAGGSLAEVISSNPAWWTPTAKAEAVVGIALALRFAHGLGLLHGCLNSGNVLFDGGGRIQIADFRPIRRDGGLSWAGACVGDGEGWSPRVDVSAFAMLLFEIVSGRPWPSPPPPPRLSAAQADEEVSLSPDVPSFVSSIIEGGLRPIAGRELSFIALIDTLKANAFRIVSDVDSDAVSAFVRGVESPAGSGESE
jgi:serine/threonine protein kinase